MPVAVPAQVRHVVMILVDAMRADRLGVYGGTAGTPVMDGLARDGTVFDNACAQAPSTRPSVSSLMTGLYPSQHGIVDRIVNVEHGVVTVAGLDGSVRLLAEVLSDAGFTTAAFLGGNANVKPVFGLTRGFQHVDWRPTTDGKVLVEDFEEWVGAGQDGPTFSYLHFMDVHHPLPMEIIPSRLDEGLDVSTVDQSADQLIACYDDAVHLVDQHIGRVLEALHSAGISEETLVIVTADHGEELTEHGAMLSHGRTLYRELVRVPLIMRLPGSERRGTVDSRPVQLIDLFPTVLDAVGQPPPDLPGRSLLTPAGTDGAGGERPAFSELHRRDLYAQAVTTSTMQLVATYLFHEHDSHGVEDLRPGVHIRVKGQPVQGGQVLATKVGISAGAATKVRGTIDARDPVRGTAGILGVEFELHPDGVYHRLDGDTAPLSALEVGDRLSVKLERREDGQGWVAVGGTERKPGGKGKVEGPIEAVTRREDAVVVNVLGLEVQVPADAVIIEKFRDKSFERSKAEAVQRMMEADYVDRRVELFDLVADPWQSRNLVEDRPDVAQELEGRLAAWTEWLSSKVTTTSSVDVDPETLDQLRRMGYLE